MRRSLWIGLLLSLFAHAALVLWRGADLIDTELPPGEAIRLEARFVPAPAVHLKPARPVRARPQAETRVARIGPEKAASAPTESASAPGAGASEPVAASQSEPVVAASAPAEAQSAPLADASAPLEATPVAERIAREGRIVYAGSAGGAVGLAAFGEASWTHDGVHLKTRLAAGLNSVDSALDYRAESLLSGPQVISLSSEDRRFSKVAKSRIDQSAGVVNMQRGADARERPIKGLAVALSALPQMLAGMDGSISKAAVFVVGDFWVEDAVVVLRGEESQRLPIGSVATRHFQSQTANGKIIDVWLAPDWHDAPVRIRIQFDGYTVDLKAASVEIDGQQLANAPDALPLEN